MCVCSLARQKRVPLSANEGSRRERERESGERARALSSDSVSSSEMEEIESADLGWRYSIPAVVGLCAPFTRRHSPLWVCPRSLRVLSLVADAKCLLHSLGRAPPTSYTRSTVRLGTCQIVTIEDGRMEVCGREERRRDERRREQQRESDCEPRDWNAVSCPEGFRCTLSSSPSSIVVRVEKDVASSRLVLISTEHMASLDCLFLLFQLFSPFNSSFPSLNDF